MSDIDCPDLKSANDAMYGEIKELRAKVERLEGVIYRNCDEMATTPADAAIIAAICRRRTLEEQVQAIDQEMLRDDKP